MAEKSTEEPFESRTMWEQLETMARGRIQEFVQALLEEEVTALVGRRKSERRESVDAPSVYRNGHGKARKLAMMGGTVEVCRPRLRGLEERFESRILPLFRRRTEQVGELLPQLYLHGLAQGTSSWRYVGCSARQRRCRRARSSVCGASGWPSSSLGVDAVCAASSRCTCGPMGSTSRRA